MELEDSKMIKLLLKLFAWLGPRKKILIIMYLTYVYVPVRKNLLNFCYSSEAITRHDSHGDLAKHHKKTVDGIMPEVHILGYGYYIVSTSVHVGGFLGGLVLIYADYFDDKRVQTVACYLPRLHIHELFGHSFLIYISFQFSLCVLAWRYLMLIYNSKMKLHTFVYLLIDQQQIARLSDPAATNNSYHNYPMHRLVQDLLFYRTGYKLNMVTKYHLRPNRLSRARRRLLRTMDIYLALSFLIYAGFSLIFSLVCSRTMLFHLDAIYPECQITHYDWSFLFRFTTSAMLTAVFLFDTLVGSVGPTLVAIILIADLNHYWHYIDEELGMLRLMIENPETLSDTIVAEVLTSHEPSLRTKPYPTSVLDKLFRPDKRSYDLQVMICDFFAQLQDADHYVSCVIVFALYIWIGFNAALTSTGNQRAGRDKTLVTLLVRSVQLSAICIIIAFSQLLLSIKNSTERGYKSICSIMAHDRSLKKTRWLSVLEYYIGKPRYAFTFQQSKIFTMATLFRFLSYTFTFIFMIQSLQLHRQ